MMLTVLGQSSTGGMSAARIFSGMVCSLVASGRAEVCSVLESPVRTRFLAVAKVCLGCAMGWRLSSTVVV